MYMTGTTSPHYARSTAANPMPAAPPLHYPHHQHYASGSSLSPPASHIMPAPHHQHQHQHQHSSGQSLSFPPSVYDDHIPPSLSSASAFHTSRYLAAASISASVSAMTNGAEERERKRRISHSAMERRRRERTNNIINELKALIPWLRNEARLQKLEVLEQCVSYIKELQQHQSAQSPRPNTTTNTTGAGTTTDALLSSPSPRKRRRTSSVGIEKQVTPIPNTLGSPHASPLPMCSLRQTMVSPNTADSAIVATARPSPATPSPLFQENAVVRSCNESTSSSDLPELVPSSSPTSSKASSTVSTISPFRGPLPANIANILPSETIPESDNCLPQVKNSISFLTM
ncbi:hypothetical protein IWW48_002632 [Coemansia sp. RSA 1200]|nr:hypothetical protein IWW48_002632 [Coemansia sp. RSA 1200]